ncbi:Ycf66 family protein [Laspinema olomoucense]|uniref:Ycf66 family protein n=1 Tax=Laspinema olomoucense TaxID=3231600 RepID=UPI0021BB6083|nr:Ycf66 family protein [Laspinema sp. D3a]MCT7987835.1 Ycf66 family protein [Laspinema sp. D3a]
MVNFSLNLASIVGIAIAIGGAGLYAVRSWRPELSRDTDLFFAAVGLLCGGILFFYGWRFDPIMQFGQILLGGSAIYFAFDNIRLRGVTTNQAKRQSGRIVDDERPVSSVYRVDAELDEIESYEENPTRRRIKGTQDPRAARNSYYADEAPRRPPSRRSPADRANPSTRARRPSSTERPPTGPSYPEWEASVDTTEERPSRRPPSSAGSSGSRKPPGARPSRTAPPEERTRRPAPSEEPAPSDYVDYQPIDPLEDDDREQDNSGNFDY